MGKSLNVALFVGNLGRDPEMVYAPSGTAITTFSIAVSDDFFDKDKEEWVQRTNWITLKAFGQAAERYSERLKKGDMVSVRAQVRDNNYEKDGVKVYTYDFIVQELQVVKRADGAGSDNDSVDEAPARSKSARSGGGRGNNSSSKRSSKYEDPF